MHKLNVCVSVCVCIRSVCVCVCAGMYIYVCVLMCVCVFVYLYCTWIYRCKCICKCTCICVCICICVYVDLGTGIDVFSKCKKKRPERTREHGTWGAAKALITLKYEQTVEYVRNTCIVNADGGPTVCYYTLADTSITIYQSWWTSIPV